MHYDEALERLLVGNRRYAAMRQLHPRQTPTHRQHLVEGQFPFAAILSCSDSRVPSELIFDQGLGDLFIVRTAGHVANEIVMASLEYAVFALKVPLLMVLGHAQCGAVMSVMKAQALPGHLPELANRLRPALETVDHQAENAVEQAVCANSKFTAALLAANSTVIGDAIAADQLRIVSAYYDLGSGRVHVLE